jgi:hypothetical protein
LRVDLSREPQDRSPVSRAHVGLEHQEPLNQGDLLHYVLDRLVPDGLDDLKPSRKVKQPRVALGRLTNFLRDFVLKSHA